MFISVKEDIKSFSAAKDKLGVEKFNKAVMRSINEAIQQGRTVARSAVKELYNIPQRYLDGVNITRATSLSLTATLYANAQPIPMDAFAPKFETESGSISISKKGQTSSKTFKRIKANPIAGVSIEVIRGKREIIPFAFLIADGAPRVFARGEYKSGASYGFVQRHQRENSEGNDIPIKPLLSITINAAVINKTSMQRIEERVNTVFPKAMERNINYMLST